MWLVGDPSTFHSEQRSDNVVLVSDRQAGDSRKKEEVADERREINAKKVTIQNTKQGSTCAVVICVSHC